MNTSTQIHDSTSGDRAAGALRSAPVQATLDRLHAAARGDWRHMIAMLPGVAWGALRGKSLMQSMSPGGLAGAYLPVSRAQGEFLYCLARTAGARQIVEFGTSFAISTIYLAAAARDNGGRVITTEIEPNKCRVAAQNLADAGLAEHAEILEGDALVTLGAVAGPVDLVFLDGWKDLYVPVIELLRPRLRPGAVVVADNINMRDARPYVDLVRRPDSGFVSTTLYGGRMELSCRVGFR